VLERHDEHRRIQRTQWALAAEAWDRHFDWNARTFRPLSDWCCEAARVASGARVLDVACGTGFPSIDEAARVGPSGCVVAVDIVPEMIRSAKRRASEMKRDNVVFCEMDAESLALPDASFDAVTCMLGLMLCPDPVTAASEMKRVLAPDGRFAFVVWDEPARNPFLAVFGRAALKALSLSRPDDSTPGPFRLARPGELERVLREGGFPRVSIETKIVRVVYESLDAYITMSRELGAGLGPKLDALSASATRDFESAVREAAAPFMDGQRVAFTASALCATG
jgi:SAM-dependent methyltransferase